MAHNAELRCGDGGLFAPPACQVSFQDRVPERRPSACPTQESAPVKGGRPEDRRGAGTPETRPPVGGARPGRVANVRDEFGTQIMTVTLLMVVDQQPKPCSY